MPCCSDFDKIISNPQEGMKKRKLALQKLIEMGCLSSLYKHTDSYARIRWIRYYSLVALVRFASINLDAEEVAIVINNDEILLKSQEDRLTLRKQAARYLFIFCAKKNKPSKMKIQAINGLVNGKHVEYLDELLQSADVEDSVKSKIKNYKN